MIVIMIMISWVPEAREGIGERERQETNDNLVGADDDDNDNVDIIHSYTFLGPYQQRTAIPGYARLGNRTT